MHDVREGIADVRADAAGIKAVLERMERARVASLGVQKVEQIVRFEGAGGVWTALLAGLTAGAVAGVGVACLIWVGAQLNRQQAKDQVQDAYINAAYQIAPQLRDQIPQEPPE